ncbi:RNA polymerase sigma factor [Lunatibacter salilacus]|uniref:RNA polymerase sigma factor n=1 Tax=Lunatibacter salilacus TaxID=2483804 RepID=UPI00131B4C03|nr:sigma-70 family RNA polymerase sigma factor [Lunatibacter salilacus]
MDFTKQTDADIWKLISKGNNPAFVYVYETYSDVLFRYGSRITTDKSLIEDSIHDVFLRIWTKRSFLTISCSLKFYLIRAFRRDLIKKVQEIRKKKYTEISEMDRHWEVSFQELILENQIILESNENVKAAINHLSDRQREAVFLRYIEGMEYQQIAELMQIKVISLYNLIQKALKNLSQSLINKQTYIKSLVVFFCI